MLYFLFVLLPISDKGGIFRSSSNSIFAKKVFTQFGNKCCGIISLLSSLILLKHWFDAVLLFGIRVFSSFQNFFGSSLWVSK